jgi:hypothetical protein
LERIAKAPGVREAIEALDLENESPITPFDLGALAIQIEKPSGVRK